MWHRNLRAITKVAPIFQGCLGKLTPFLKRTNGQLLYRGWGKQSGWWGDGKEWKTESKARRIPGNNLPALFLSSTQYMHLIIDSCWICWKSGNFDGKLLLFPEVTVRWDVLFLMSTLDNKKLLIPLQKSISLTQFNLRGFSGKCFSTGQVLFWQMQVLYTQMQSSVTQNNIYPF